jgi:hypothetical protein
MQPVRTSGDGSSAAKMRRLYCKQKAKVNMLERQGLRVSTTACYRPSGRENPIAVQALNQLASNEV